MNNWGNRWYEVVGWALFSLHGRLNRKGYIWGFVLTFVALWFVVAQIIFAPDDSSRQTLWGGVFIACAALFTWCQIALAAKRLRDFNWSPWLALLVPFTQPISFLILTFKKSEPVDSIFADMPKSDFMDKSNKFGR